MDQTFIKEKLNALREAKGLSFSALNSALQINRHTLKKLFDGDVQSTRDKAMLRAVIEYLGQTEDEFFNRTTQKGSAAPAPTAAGSQLIPLYGDVPAGNPFGVDGNAQPEEWIAPPYGVRPLNVFALRVRGNSMLPRFESGDLVFFKRLHFGMGPKDVTRPVPRHTFEDLRDRCVAVLVDGDATFKQLKILGKEDSSYELELAPLNKEFSALRILPEHSVQFQGVAIANLRIER